MDELQQLKRQQEVIFESMAGILGAMASPVRIRLMHFLSQAPLTVEVLALKTDHSVANTSMHLRKMLNEGLVSVEKRGKNRLYTLKAPVLHFWESSIEFLQKLDPTLKIETEEIDEDINWIEGWDETRTLIKKRRIVILDVRPNDEVVDSLNGNFEILHIPQNDLRQNLNKLPKRKKIVVLCRGRVCALSVFTVNYLRARGFKAYRLESSWTRLKYELSK